MYTQAFAIYPPIYEQYKEALESRPEIGVELDKQRALFSDYHHFRNFCLSIPEQERFSFDYQVNHEMHEH